MTRNTAMIHRLSNQHEHFYPSLPENFSKVRRYGLKISPFRTCSALLNIFPCFGPPHLIWWSAETLPENAAGNELLHDFIGAAINGLHLGVHIGPADGVLCHVATTTKQLHTMACYLVLQVLV
ncbi:hypothetical protein E2C01_021270 [Portunus trituberculatus]|uniref:Uncharacterized protein n=1 Tax=Portunus trituberculatus TaxID=210409 RepID=A0A5B7E3X8_PORTR|nr:hypothetical protein [Portunus trituberculatus]